MESKVNGVFRAVKEYVGEGYVDLKAITVKDASVEGKICLVDKSIKGSLVRETLASPSKAFSTRHRGVLEGATRPIDGLAKRMVAMVNQIYKCYDDVYMVYWDLNRNFFQIFKESGMVINGTVSNMEKVEGIEVVRSGQKK